MMTTPKTAGAVKVQQTRQDRLEELYYQDGRHDPSHPKHGLYTGLVQTTQQPTLRPMNFDFVFFTLKESNEKVAIRRSSINALNPCDSVHTFIEYTGESVIVQESFDQVCAMLGITALQ